MPTIVYVPTQTISKETIIENFIKSIEGQLDSYYKTLKPKTSVTLYSVPSLIIPNILGVQFGSFFFLGGLTLIACISYLFNDNTPERARERVKYELATTFHTQTQNELSEEELDALYLRVEGIIKKEYRL